MDIPDMDDLLDECEQAVSHPVPAPHQSQAGQPRCRVFSRPRVPTPELLHVQKDLEVLPFQCETRSPAVAPLPSHVAAVWDERDDDVVTVYEAIRNEPPNKAPAKIAPVAAPLPTVQRTSPAETDANPPPPPYSPLSKSQPTSVQKVPSYSTVDSEFASAMAYLDKFADPPSAPPKYERQEQNNRTLLVAEQRLEVSPSPEPCDVDEDDFDDDPVAELSYTMSSDDCNTTTSNDVSTDANHSTMEQNGAAEKEQETEHNGEVEEKVQKEERGLDMGVEEETVENKRVDEEKMSEETVEADEDEEKKEMARRSAPALSVQVPSEDSAENKEEMKKEKGNEQMGEEVHIAEEKEDEGDIVQAIVQNGVEEKEEQGEQEADSVHAPDAPARVEEECTPEGTEKSETRMEEDVCEVSSDLADLERELAAMEDEEEQEQDEVVEQEEQKHELEETQQEQETAVYESSVAQHEITLDSPDSKADVQSLSECDTQPDVADTQPTEDDTQPLDEDSQSLHSANYCEGPKEGDESIYGEGRAEAPECVKNYANQLSMEIMDQLTIGEDGGEVVETMEQEEKEEEENNTMEQDGSDLPREEQEEQAEEQDEHAPMRFMDRVIATVHDISQEPDARLTESELQLGKVKPYWIPDADCVGCMLCEVKFSLINRRHHCRACGRVLCSGCVKHKASLAYLEDADKQAKVCSPCFDTLQRIEEYERSAPVDGDDTAPSPSVVQRSLPTAPRGVLKTRTRSETEEEEGAGAEGEEEGEQRLPGKKRSVVFRDGVKPGDAIAPSPSVADPASTSHDTGADTPAPAPLTVPLQKKKKTRKRHSVARRISELKMEEEMVCLLREDGGAVANTPQGWSPVDSSWLSQRLSDGCSVEVAVKRNLTAIIQIVKLSDGARAWVVYTSGMAALGMDELFVAWQCASPDLPIKLLRIIDELPSVFISPSSSSSGLIVAARRAPLLLPLDEWTDMGAAMLLYRVEAKCMWGLPHPSSPFLVASFIRPSERVWAEVCPQRLVARLALLTAWYPVPIVNDPNRGDVYSSETSQTVLKVLTDFRGWSYRLQQIAGASIRMTDTTVTLTLPYSGRAEVRELIGWNRNMVAWAGEVGGGTAASDLDSHLVCMEEDGDGFYTTQLISREGKKGVTGATFVIIDGGLKGVNDMLQWSLVEDGVTIRLRGEALSQLVEALINAQDFSFSGDGRSVYVEWSDGVSAGMLLSPIDSLPLGDKLQYGLSLERVVTSALQVPSHPSVGIRLSHVFSLEDSRLPPDDEYRMFGFTESIFAEAASMLEPHLETLIQLGCSTVALRFLVDSECMSYEVSPWLGMEEEQMRFKQALDQLTPTLIQAGTSITKGYHVEMHISFVKTQ